MQGAPISLRGSGGELFHATTSAKRSADFQLGNSGTVQIRVESQGLLSARIEVEIGGQETSATIGLALLIARIERVEAPTDAEPGDKRTTEPMTTSEAHKTKDVPNKPATVAGALPPVPGAIRSPEGQLVIDGRREHPSAMLVNGRM